MGKAKNKPKSNPAAIWVVAGVAVVAVGALIAFGVMRGGDKTAETPPALVAGVKTDTELKAVKNQMGSTSAKVTVVEWGDYL